MTDALNNPVRRPRREVSTADMPISQMDELDVSLEADMDDRQRIVEADEAVLKQEYAEALLFSEQPVKIVIGQAAERNAPTMVDCYCNGKGAEVLENGRWREQTWLPTNRPVITKIKYLEVLLRSKNTSYTSEMALPGQQFLNNRFHPNTTSRNPISIVGAKDVGMVSAWAAAIMNERE